MLHSNNKYPFFYMICNVSFCFGAYLCVCISINAEHCKLTTLRFDSKRRVVNLQCSALIEMGVVVVKLSEFCYVGYVRHSCINRYVNSKNMSNIVVFQEEEEISIHALRRASNSQFCIMYLSIKSGLVGSLPHTAFNGN